MPFTPITDVRYNEVVLEEADNLRSRDKASVNNAAGGNKLLGTVVWRAKGTDPAADWDVVDAAGDLATANEYAVLIGDNYSIKNTIALTAGVDTQCLILARDARVKESVLKAIHVTGGFTSGNFETLKHLLKASSIIVEDSLTPYATTP